MGTLHTEIGEIELVDGFDEAVEYDLLAGLIELWRDAPENIDERAMANYFKPVSPECFVNLYSGYNSNEHDFTSYAVVRSLAEYFNVDAGEANVTSAYWWKVFAEQYGVKLTEVIADTVSYGEVDIHQYVA